MTNKITLVIGGILVALNLIAGFLAYPHLPEKVPVHWNIAGEVDRWGSSWQGAFMIPLIILGLYLLFIFLPKIDPKKKSYIQMGRAYGSITLVIMFVFTIIYFGTLGATMGYLENLPSIVMIGVGTMLLVIGNYMGKLKHNYFVGIRTPWTLANEEVWYKTHRMAGPFWMVGGLLYIATSLMASSYLMIAIVITIFILVFIPTVYSFVIFKRLVNGQ